MSVFMLKDLGRFIDEHETTIELPIKYVLHRPANASAPEELNISIYQELYLGGNLSSRSSNSDIPVCTWNSSGGFCWPNSNLTVASQRGTWLRDAGLLPQIEQTCRAIYDAWKKGQEEDE